MKPGLLLLVHHSIVAYYFRYNTCSLSFLKETGTDIEQKMNPRNLSLLAPKLVFPHELCNASILVILQ